MEAGIDVFKIEGRSKSAEYVYTTTKCYREAIDAVSEGSYTDEKVKKLVDRVRQGVQPWVLGRIFYGEETRRMD